MKNTRREFLQASGALVVCFSLPACSKTVPLATGQAVLGNRLVLHASGYVELMLGKVEIGQGIGTALAQIAAEELDVSFDRIRLMPVTTDYSPDESYTFSSISIQQSGPPTRKAAAAARAYLLQSAAGQLSVPVDSLRVIDGAIQLRDGTGQSSYWELIGDAQINIDIPEEQMQKSVDDYSVVGTSQQRIDIPAKVFGDAMVTPWSARD